MEYKTIEKCGWKVSNLCFGGASLSGAGGGYGFGNIEKRDAQELVEYALNAGINFFDTAPIYGFGESEKVLGELLYSVREKVHIVSKAGVGWHEDNKRVNMSNDPKLVLKMFEASLRDLKSDYIDLYMIHWPDKNVDIRRSLEVLESLKSRGKIKSIGLCNTNLEDLKKSEDICEIDFVQSEYNLFNNAFDTIESYLSEKMISKMGWGTFDKGILTGSVDSNRTFDSSDCRSWAPWWRKSNWKEKCQMVESFSTKGGGFSVKEIALAYSLRSMTTSICGTKKIEQLKELIDISAKKVDDSVLDETLEYFCE